MKQLVFILTLVLTSKTTFGQSDFDWPQWQGPDRNAVSKETGLLQEWPEAGPPLSWRIEGLGGGYSAPSIAAGRLYGMSSKGDDEVVWCLSEADGAEVWVSRIGPAIREGMPQGSEGPGCTPTVEGDRLYALGLGGELACLQTEDGKIVWQRNLVKDFGGRLPMWRYNESPLVDGDKVICTPGGEDATLIALNKSTGDVIWKSKVPDRAGGGERAENRPEPDRRRPSSMRIDPVLMALDADEDEEISSEEIDKATAALIELDKNGDGKLTEEEVTPDFGRRGGQDGERRGRESGRPGGRSRGRGFSIMRMMPADRALDADESGDISQAEIKNAAAVLRKLDKNSDGKLTADEVSPQFGRGGPRGAPSGAAYSSAIAIDFEGQRQYVQLTGTTLVGVAASDGKVLWRYDRPANTNRINCTTPIYQDGLVFAASAYGAGGGLLKLSKDASGAVSAEEVYSTTYMQNHHGGMIVFDGALYGANGGNGGGFLTCLNFETGDVLWRDRNAQKGALVFADGRLYLYTESGTLLLIEPNREQYVERGRFEQPDRTESPAWTHPVIANGKLYVRDQDTLFCYDVKSK